jgi:hypothetical protein
MTSDTIEEQQGVVHESNRANSPNMFIEYVSGKNLIKNIIPKSTQFLSLACSPEIPAYAIKTRRGIHAEPDIELHFGQDLTYPLVAVGRLQHLRNHNFGVSQERNETPGGGGNVFIEDGRGEEFMTWENLRQATRWTKRVYEFEWGVGKERREYTWMRTKGTGLIKVMELRIGTRAEAERGGECLARWVKGPGITNQKKGSLFVKRGTNEKDSRWEFAVLVTFLMILEIVIRDG